MATGKSSYRRAWGLAVGLTVASLAAAKLGCEGLTPTAQAVGAGTGAIVSLVLLGALLGATGQGARAVVGIKKEYDLQSAAGQADPNWFKLNELLVSLIIGAIAGVCAAVLLYQPGLAPDKSELIGLLAAGYAGADFIEGFMKSNLPATKA